MTSNKTSQFPKFSAKSESEECTDKVVQDLLENIQSSLNSVIQMLECGDGKCGWVKLQDKRQMLDKLKKLKGHFKMFSSDEMPNNSECGSASTTQSEPIECDSDKLSLDEAVKMCYDFTHKQGGKMVTLPRQLLARMCDHVQSDIKKHSSEMQQIKEMVAKLSGEFVELKLKLIHPKLDPVGSGLSTAPATNILPQKEDLGTTNQSKLFDGKFSQFKSVKCPQYKPLNGSAPSELGEVNFRGYSEEPDSRAFDIKTSRNYLRSEYSRVYTNTTERNRLSSKYEEFFKYDKKGSASQTPKESSSHMFKGQPEQVDPIESIPSPGLSNNLYVPSRFETEVSSYNSPYTPTTKY